MNIVVLGMNNETAPVEIREKLAFRNQQLTDALDRLRERPGLLECVILSTCNRVEIYALLDDSDASTLEAFLREHHGIRESITDKIYIHKNEGAIDHLCRVACGMDSMIIGEPQIFGQVKDAYDTAAGCGAAGIVLRSLFTQVFTLVKRLRSRTAIGRASTSVSHAAVSCAEKALGTLAGKTVMVIGAGEMSELAVRSLKEKGTGRVLVCNRTFERAVRLAESLRGTPIMLHELAEYLPDSDIIISSVEASDFVLAKESIAERLPGKPLVIVDISVPRSVDPAIGQLPNVLLINIDDLRDAVTENVAAREKEMHRAAGMIRDRVPEIWRKLDSPDLSALIVSLRQQAECIRSQAVQDFLRENDMQGEDRQVVDVLTRSIVNRVVHEVIAQVREHSNTLRYR